MKRGTFKISTNLFRFRDSAIIAKVFVRNDNKAILTKTLTIQQPITPETEVKKSVVYNDPEAESINYYYSLFEQEVKRLAETSTPETIADDIQKMVKTPVFSKFFSNGKRCKRVTQSPPQKKRVGKSVQWGRHYRKRDIDRDVRIIRGFDPYAFNDDFQNKGHVLHTKQFNRSGEPLCIKENYKQAVKNGSYSGTQEGYYAKIKPYLTDIESWQQIQDDEELKEKIEIYSNGRLIDFALNDEPTEEKEYAPYISRDQWEVMMDDYIKKLKIKWQREKELQTAEK